MRKRNQTSPLLREALKLRGTLESGNLDDATVQNYAEVIGRVLLTNPDAETLRSLDIKVGNWVQVNAAAWTQRDYEFLEAMESGDVERVRSMLLEEHLSDSDVEGILDSMARRHG